MIRIKIDLKSVAIATSLNALTKGMDNREALHGSMAESLANLTRGHLDAKYVPKNERGDFWARVREGVEAQADENRGEVSLNELGIRLRYMGGTVYPGKGISSYTGELTRALSVPSLKVPIVGGRQVRPARAGLLAFIRRVTGGETVGFLVQGQEEGTVSRGPRKGSKRIKPKPGGDLLYTLRTVTRHTGDKGILPDDADLLSAAAMVARDWVDSFEE